VPAEERQGIRFDDAALNSELLRMTDAYADVVSSDAGGGRPCDLSR
jgi:hypothetical protein